MLSLGMDIGTSTVKLVLLKDKEIEKQWMAVHHGNPFVCLKKGLSTLELAMDTPFSLCVTGSNTEALLEQDSAIPSLGDIPAIVEGVRWIIPQVGSVIEIGSQGARFITDLQSRAPQFSVNEHCAGGTGSFFEDQMSRVGCRLGDYSSLVEQAQSVPRLSGRCAVFAKTDIIHRQQEGVSTPDILLGLCYAMIRNYKVTIVRRLPICKPVVFCGGVTCNAGVIRAIRDVFGLSEKELIVPEFARYEAALGAALKASGSFTLRQLNDSLDRTLTTHHMVGTLPKLELRSGTSLAEPNATKIIPESGCALGIDIGSTSTDLVLVGADGELVDFQYLRTAGDPEGAVRKGLASIRQRFGDIRFTAVGVTGSGRERIGKRIGADAVRDEITAQAKGAAHWVPEVDTVFEIGGQDSKYISIQNGEVVDFQMNKICAAGTGSFVEEQAARMGIPLAEFGPLALSSEHPASLGERCTVFIETAIASASAEGISRADIAAGLCHSIVQNYLHKVVGSKPVGQHIVLQGGVDYNPGIVAAFQSAYGDRVQVSPVFSISGAYGAALLAQEAVGDALSRFVGFDSPAKDAEDSRSAEIQKNIDFYKQADKLLLEGYTGKRDPRKKTVGVPFALMIHKFFPMTNAFFTSLGFNVVLTDPTSEETIRLAQKTAQGETCYPVKLIYGHMQQLIDQKVDYIFLPTIHTMKHEKSRVKHNYGCVYMQTAAASIAKALLSGAMAVRRHTAAVEKQGKALLATLRPDDKVLVLITRNYGVSDPILNMGIPELLLERGYKVITLSHLPGHALDISDEYDNLYYPFGQHILSGAKLIAHHPNLYAVYLTNHGCGPDTMLSHLFKQEMGDKPYLQIEVDEHFSNVGVITRIEAFLNSLQHRPAVALPTDFNIEQVDIHPCRLAQTPSPNVPLYLPAMGAYTPYLAAYFKQQGADPYELPHLTDDILSLGRAETSAKEYLPFPALLGSILAERKNDHAHAQFLIPQTQGAEADGQYARVIRAVLDRRKEQNAQLISPMLETLPEMAQNCDALFRALLAGDILYAAPADKRADISAQWDALPGWEQLHTAAREIGALLTKGRRIAAVGTPLCLTELDSGVLAALEAEGEQVLRAPLSEALWFLWKDNLDENKPSAGWLDQMQRQMQTLGNELGAHSAFAEDAETLFLIADSALPNFSGGNGRYRYAKAVELSNRTNAVLTLAPRYENTAMILDMRGLHDACRAPVFQLSLDNDWDETAWSRLRSFLYYC